MSPNHGAASAFYIVDRRIDVGVGLTHDEGVDKEPTPNGGGVQPLGYGPMVQFAKNNSLHRQTHD